MYVTDGTLTLPGHIDFAGKRNQTVLSFEYSAANYTEVLNVH
jgi:hypothetical protein